MMPATQPQGSSPYADGAPLYWAAGWRGILPLPPHAKKPVPVGWTGREGHWPSVADIYAWAEDRHGANLGLRLPLHVIGIDVDAYDDKIGAQTLKEAEDKWGALPPTWRSTSRDDGISGIRLYRIPEGLAWPGEVGPDIEIIRWCHRYTVAWPSLHPQGRTYRWIDPDGITRIGDVPEVDELPDLPETWIVGLSHGEADNALPKADLDDPAVNTWLIQRGEGQPCKATQRALDRYLHDLEHTRGSRHDAGLYGQRRIAGLAAEGHRGALAAMGQLHKAFIAAATGPGKDQRTSPEALAEWRRGLAGAIRLAAAQPEGDGDPCDAPFGDLIAPVSPAQLVDGTNDLPVGEATAGAVVDEDKPSELIPSWRPVDLGPYLDGTYQAPTATGFVRTDGVALLYPGLVHSFHGESESGKSLIAQAEAARQIADGHNVAYIDWESDAAAVTGRMLELGLTADQVKMHLTYIRPESSPYAAAELPEWRSLLGHTFVLAVLDGVTDALGTFGGSTKDNDEIAAFMRSVPRMLATRTGAAVVLIDHVTKDPDSRGRYALGGQAKMNALDGAAYVVEIGEPIGRGMRGTIVMRIAKDRPGSVRPKCGKWRTMDRTQEAARVIVDSTDGPIEVIVEPPRGNVSDPQQDSDNGFRPTGIMEKASRLLEAAGEEMSRTSVFDSLKRDGVKARKQTVLEAIQLLVDEDYLASPTTREGSPRPVRHTRPYRQKNDPTSDSYEAPFSDITPPVPTGSHRFREPVHPTGSPVPHPEGGTGTGEAASGTASQVDRFPEPVDVCRVCGTVIDRTQDTLVKGVCKDCRLAGRKART
jgi:hypothetical protein